MNKLLIILSGVLFTVVACSHLANPRKPAQAYDSQAAEMLAGSTLTMKTGFLSFANLTGKEMNIEKSCRVDMVGSVAPVECKMNMLVPAHKVYKVTPEDTLTVDKTRDNYAVFFHGTSGKRMYIHCESTNGAEKKYHGLSANAANRCFQSILGKDNEIKFTNPELPVERIRYEQQNQDTNGVINI